MRKVAALMLSLMLLCGTARAADVPAEPGARLPQADVPAGQGAAETVASTGTGAAGDADLLIRRSTPAAGQGPADGSSASNSTGGTAGGYIQQVTLGLGVVLLLILAMRWAGH